MSSLPVGVDGGTNICIFAISAAMDAEERGGLDLVVILVLDFEVPPTEGVAAASEPIAAVSSTISIYDVSDSSAGSSSAEGLIADSATGSITAGGWSICQSSSILVIGGNETFAGKDVVVEAVADMATVARSLSARTVNTLRSQSCTPIST